MSIARVRLVVAAAAFVGWLGWLGYLAASKTNPTVVSHSQVMAATRFVVAEVTIDTQSGLPQRQVNVLEDLRPVGAPLEGTIVVENIRNGRIAGAKEFRERTKYLLPLTPSSSGAYSLTMQPRSPGQEVIKEDKLQPWAYLWDDPEVQRQFEALVSKR
ncbi:MAG TPA: hypothetical protein VHR66_09410 [Gemmataceae bacterium]|jgi:hypothetical protein|nr:hypothetical protein [Gemmataceae bacterium]